MIDLLAHHSVLSNPTGESLPLGKAFRRLIQILAAGIFLPGSVGLTDPCAPGPYRIHTTLSLAEQDGICMTGTVILKVRWFTGRLQISDKAQTLNRALAHGAVKKIVGLEDDGQPISDVLLLGEARVLRFLLPNCLNFQLDFI